MFPGSHLPVNIDREFPWYTIRKIINLENYPFGVETTDERKCSLLKV
uniref:Uncharacterized protein n=1 Tax=Rhizophora mucronata TaxID=61149 RepID=A0A2P2MZT1_RHIMU